MLPELGSFRDTIDLENKSRGETGPKARSHEKRAKSRRKFRGLVPSYPSFLDRAYLVNVRGFYCFYIGFSLTHMEVQEAVETKVWNDNGAAFSQV